MRRVWTTASEAAAKTHAVAAISLKNTYLLRLVESRLLQAGIDVVRTRDGNHNLLRRLLQARVVVLIEDADEANVATEVSFAVPALDGSSTLVFQPVDNLPAEPDQALHVVMTALAQSGIVTATELESGT